MEKLKATVAENLVALRQEAGITQLELAESLHYSDKAVSKWERGESLPDVAVLKAIADRFDVTVDFLITAHTDAAAVKEELQSTVSTHTITLLAVVSIWAAAILLAVIFWMAQLSRIWLVFIGTVPVTLITLLVLNSLWNKGKHNLWIVQALVLSIFALVCLCLPSQINPWRLLLVLLPAELVVWLSFRVRRRKAKK